MAFQRIARQVIPVALLASLLAGAIYATRGARLEPADFVFNNGTEVQTLDPATVTEMPEGRAIRMLFEGLLVSHPETLQPLLASQSDGKCPRTASSTRSTCAETPLSNGDPVTAEDFMWSFQRFLDPQTAAEYAYMLWYVEGAEAFTTEVEDGKAVHGFDTVGITAPDEHTIRFRLKAPTPFFLELMAFYPMFPVNRRNIEEAKERFPDRWQQQWLRPENIVCNGPYVVEFRRVNDRIRFAKNPRYWDADNVAFETVTPWPWSRTRRRSTSTSRGVPLDRRAPGERHPGADAPGGLQPDPLPGHLLLQGQRHQAAPGRPARAAALSLTIPRKDICEKVTKAGQVPAYALVPPGLAGYTNANMRHGASYEEDVAEAKRLMEEAGYGAGGKTFPTIEIHYNTADAHMQIALVIADAWSKYLGINAKLLNQEWKVYLDTQSNIGYDVSRSAWIGDYADPNNFVDLFVTGGENNKTGWGNEDYDRLVRDAAAELDPAKRMAMLREAEAILVDELPVLPIYNYVTQTTFSPRLGGYFPNVKDEHFPKLVLDGRGGAGGQARAATGS